MGEVDYSEQDKGQSEIKPAVVGTEALSKMSEWGVTPELTNELADIVGSFDYGNVENRIIRMTSEDVFVANDQQGERYIVIPDFYNPSEGLQGNCTELSFKLVTSEKFQTWFDKANQASIQESGKPLEVCICNGKSDQFFNDSEGDSHQWVGLRQQGSPLEEDLIDMDSALGTIKRASEHNYVHEDIYLPADKVIEHPRSATIKLGKMEISEDGNSVFANYEGHITLGLSSRGEHAYNITFVENADSNDLTFVVTRINRDGNERSTFFVEPGTNDLVGGGYIDLNESDIDELQGIFLAGKNFRRNNNLAEFPYEIDAATLSDIDANLAVGKLPS